MLSINAAFTHFSSINKIFKLKQRITYESSVVRHLEG